MILDKIHFLQIFLLTLFYHKPKSQFRLKCCLLKDLSVFWLKMVKW